MDLQLYIIMILLVLLLAVFRSVKFRGRFGEELVKWRLSRLPRTDYLVIHDLLIRRPNGKTAQIDHIIVSRFGIFVIETKNYRGIITGRDYDQYWTQTIYRHKERFYNPVKQNYAHIKALQELLPDVDPWMFESIIVFSDEAQLNIDGGRAHVVNLQDLLDIIGLLSPNVAFSQKKAIDIHDRLVAAHVRDSGAKRKHVKRIKQDVRTRTQSIRKGICPRCGHPLIHRTGRNGPFIGCSNFPKCRFTTDV